MNLPEAMEYMKKGGKARRKDFKNSIYYINDKILFVYFKDTKEEKEAFLSIGKTSDFYDDNWEKYISVLDDEEKRYIKTIITPFKDKMLYIAKEYAGDKTQGLARIIVCLESKYVVPFERIEFPIFSIREHKYENMEMEKTYRLTELDL